MIPVNEVVNQIERNINQLTKLVKELHIDPVDLLQLDEFQKEIKEIRRKAILISEEINRRMIQEGIDRRVIQDRRRAS